MLFCGGFEDTLLLTPLPGEAETLSLPSPSPSILLFPPLHLPGSPLGMLSACRDAPGRAATAASPRVLQSQRGSCHSGDGSLCSLPRRGAAGHRAELLLHRLPNLTAITLLLPTSQARKGRLRPGTAGPIPSATREGQREQGT